MNAKEEFYDREIAPKLLDLAKACEDAGVSIVAVANWGTDDQGRTAALQATAPFSIKLVEVAARANGNVDSLIMALMKYGREHGHSSACLSLLGVPASSREAV